jgi:hypothetical protein
MSARLLSGFVVLLYRHFASQTKMRRLASIGFLKPLPVPMKCIMAKARQG